MADVKVILSLEAVQATDNIAMGNSSEEKKVVIDSIVSLDDVTTDDQRALSDVEDAIMKKETTMCPQFEVNEIQNVNNAMNSGNARRKKHRRGRSKKRKWKPYNKLTWDEKRQREDRESLRAHRIRAELFAHGKPVAPYNTTQFLMDDHNEQGPNLGDLPNGRPPLTEQQRQRRESGTGLESDDYYSSPEDEEEFLQKEFSQVYQNIHAERLSSMTKMDLIHEYMLLEERVEMLEESIKEERGTVDVETKQLQQKIQLLEDEIKVLRSENDELKTVSPGKSTEEDSSVHNQISRSESAVDDRVAVDDNDEKETQLNKALTKVSVDEFSSVQVMEQGNEETVTSESQKSCDDTVDQIMMNDSMNDEGGSDDQNNTFVSCQQEKEEIAI